MNHRISITKSLEDLITWEDFCTGENLSLPQQIKNNLKAEGYTVEADLEGYPGQKYVKSFQVCDVSIESIDFDLISYSENVATCGCCTDYEYFKAWDIEVTLSFTLLTETETSLKRKEKAIEIVERKREKEKARTQQLNKQVEEKERAELRRLQEKYG